jgi:hypothetical protein
MEINTKIITAIYKDKNKFWIVLVFIAISIIASWIYVSVVSNQLNTGINKEISTIAELEAKVDSLRIRNAEQTGRAELFIELYNKCIGNENEAVLQEGNNE